MSREIVLSKQSALSVIEAEAARTIIEVNKIGSLESVLNEKVVRDIGAGEDLTDRQHRLAATVVSVMQDRVISTLEAGNERLRTSLENAAVASTSALATIFSQQGVSAFRQFLATPMIQNSSPSSAGEENPKNPVEPPTLFQTVFTWGNFVSGAAILLVGVSLWLTNTYTHYKDRAENLAKQVEMQFKETEDLRKKTTEVEAANKLLTAENSKLREDLAGVKERLLASDAEVNRLAEEVSKKAGLTPELAALQKELTAKAAELSNERTERVRATERYSSALRESERTQGYLEDANKRISALNQQVTKLNQENLKLAQAASRKP